MPTKRFLIAPLDGGFQNNIRPWLIPNNAFESLQNMYVFRGRTRKRFGSDLMRDEDSAYNDATAQLGSRLRINIGTTAAGTGNFTSSTPCVTGGLFKQGQMFSIGTTIFTVIDDTAGAQDTLTTGSATATFDVSTGVLIVTGNTENPSTAVYFYPSEPVMGIAQNETALLNDEPTYAFDTRFAYQYTNGAWERLGSTATGAWTGNDDDFFWGSSWRGPFASDTYFFVSNFNFGSSLNDSDPLKYWDSANWNNFQLQFTSTATSTILTARVVMPFKDRLLLLNVVENKGAAPGTNTQYGNRCRFSQNGDPTNSNAFREDLGGRGGYIDAPTKEQIVSAEYLKDRLIVWFERSTWELVYTGNEILPFRWQQINTELGVESTFSVVPFDDVVRGVGNVGIHACNGSSVQRVDNKIPDFVFNFNNENEGVKRVQGIRDYFVEQVYWTFPGGEDETTFPNMVLVYDYKTDTWGVNDDSITAFGYFQNQDDRTWESSSETWQEAEFPWNTPTILAKHRQVLAGNQQGFLFIVDSEDSRNAPALQITQIAGSDLNELEVVDHNLQVNDYVALENVNGVTYPNTINFAQVKTVTDANNIVVDLIGTGTYSGGGTVARVSKISAKTKQYNFFNELGVNMAVDQVDFLVDKTDGGEFTSNSLPSSSTDVIETFTVETRPYDSNLYPLEQSQARVWHSIYPSVNGEVAQFEFTFSDTQMRDEDIVWSDFQLHAMLFYVQSTSARFE